MKPLLQGASFLAAGILFSMNLLLSGCGTSIETTSAQSQADSLTVDSLQAENQRLQADNAQLRKTNSQLDQDKKALNAKVADLSSKLGQSSEQWQDLQDLQNRVGSLDSELTVEKQINRDLSAKNADMERQTMSASSITTKAEFNKVYNEGLKLFKARKYNNAVNDFSNLAASKMNHPLISNSHYWLGECYYEMEKYDGARDEFAKTLTYPKSYKAGPAYIMLGMSYLRLGDKDKAKSTWQTFVKKYPKSKYAAKAKDYLEEL
ncbi:MAG: tetratricopeptide repeat protein [Candidatus Kryptoniota bacterium]